MGNGVYVIYILFSCIYQELVRYIDEKMKPMIGFDVIKIALTYYAS